MILAAALAMSGAIGPGPSLPPAWQAWRAVAPIRAAVRPGLVRVALPIWVYAASEPDLGDLRVIDDTAAEVPFAIDQVEESTTVEWANAPLSEQGFVRGQYTQVVADVGTSGSLHNAITVNTLADDFSTWVEVAASDDKKTWRIVRDKAPIFRFSSDGLAGNQTVHFDPTGDRWLRIHVLRGDAEFHIISCVVANDVRVVPDLAIVAPVLKRGVSPIASQTRFSVDFGAPNIPVSAVRFRTTSADFYRTVDVSVSNEGKDWAEAGQGDIYRDPRAGTSLEVRFPEERGRYYRVTVFNRSDRPLRDLAPTLLATPRYVSFRSLAGRRYRLLYDYPKADAPQYDFETLTSADERLKAPVTSLGQPSIAPPAPVVVPWTESHAFVLWIALLVAVAVLAWLAVGAMRNRA